MTPPDQLSPRDWLTCVYNRSINPDTANPLRFTFTGVVATGDALLKWKDRKGVTLDLAIKQIRSSHEFAGTAQAHDDAIQALIALSPMEKRSICIRPVQIADDDGKNPTSLPSFDAAKAIWGKCCIDLTVNAAQTVSKTAFKTLERSPIAGPRNAEENSLFDAAGGGGGCVSVLVPETFQRGSVISKDIDGGGVTYHSGAIVPGIAVVEGVDPTIVAHELGHAMGYKPHAPAGTVMEVTAAKHDQKESNRVAGVICERVRNFATSSGGKEDCRADVT